MAVQVLGVEQEVDGYGDSMKDFRDAHEGNAAVLLNLTEGKNKNAPRPAYNPQHRDNQWPVMVYHPEKGELIVGKTLKGVEDVKAKDSLERSNNASLKAAKDAGYRTEPYPKPQVALADPASEKKAMLDENSRLKGMIVSLEDRFSKLMERLEGNAGEKKAMLDENSRLKGTIVSLEDRFSKLMERLEGNAGNTQDSKP